MTQRDVIDALQKLAAENGMIDALWLYGSQVKGNADENSDYDLAIAFAQNGKEKAEYYHDELAEMWSVKTAEPISIVDINKIPTPLAYSIIEEGSVIFCRSSLRVHAEQTRIWSLWELFRYEHRKHRKQL